MTAQSIFSKLFISIIASMAIIQPAFAEEAGQGSGFASLIPLILIMVIFYFLLIRPQQKKLKEHRNLVNEIKKGDTILTGGGLYAKVIDVKDDILKVEIADGIRVKVKRDTIAGLSDIAPEKENPAKGKASKKGKQPKAKAIENTTAEDTSSEKTDSQDKA